MDLLHNFYSGIGIAFQPLNLFVCVAGVFFGTLIGALPGIGAIAAVSMLLPSTFYLEPVTALVMLAGVYYGAEYGGSIASILLNIPGTTSSAVVCLDGNPMARQGRAGVALLITAVASYTGGTIGIVLLMAGSPLLVALAQSFGPAEYFSFMLLGLAAAGMMGSGSPAKGLAMIVLGLLLGCIGADVNTAAPRFTFGLTHLYDGINVIVVAMGLFGITEVIFGMMAPGRSTEVPRVSLRSMVPTPEDRRRAVMPILRGSTIGSILGVLPGAGATLSTFMSYSLEKSLARDPSRFGKGAVEGIAGPESSNNAAAQTAFIPTLTLGIPGTATMALMLGAMMIHGIQPGPAMMTQHADIFWGLIASFWIGNAVLLVLNIPLIGIWVQMLRLPSLYLYPTVISLICMGVYSINFAVADILLVLLFGLLGCALRLLKCEPAPLLIAFVLGPMMEENFRRAMLMSRGDVATFVERPLSLAILAVTVAIAGGMLLVSLRRRRAAQ
ncbi:tripartite tricarboxylate transporter permease [Poseidonocella sp. HB161398]|uniref:tripartite tricarboxylate transporter permease n=1 Tax=Poseidonocella sp. HB161398 TaxID=2320855 RepID=UPI001109FCAA|nr:tripartite tricarboxylate transporter permease [Poseidonocella sp. HB161398]